MIITMVAGGEVMPINTENFSDYGIKVPIDATGQIKTTCPKCSHLRKKKRDKCLSVNIDEGVWNCHHCGWDGYLKRKSENYTGMKEKYKKPKWENKKEKLPNKIIKWFKSRGISEDTVKEFDIQVKETWMPARDKKVKSIAFPFKENGKTVNIKYRDLKKNFKQSKGGKKILFGLDRVPENEDTLIITEGEMDTLALVESGLDFVVSVPDGAPNPNAKNLDNKMSYLKNCEERLKKFDNFILAVDNDPQGIKLRDELARRLGYEKCYKVEYPKDCKDLNDVLVEYTKNIVCNIISNAEEFPIYGVYTISDTREKILDFYKNGYKKAYSTGFADLDEYYKVRPQEYTTITGIPGHGKSEFLDSVIMNMIKNHNWKFGIFSPENHPVQRHHVKLVEKARGKKFHDMKEDKLNQILDYLEGRIFSIAPKDEQLSIENILNKTTQLIFRYGINALVIDPFNELEHKKPKHQQMTHYVSDFLSKIRHYSREKDIHIFIIAHPTKGVNSSKGKVRVPNAYDISDSANWYNKGDNIISVFRDKNDFTEIHIQKIRFHEIGKKGMVTLNYDITKRNFTETLDNGYDNNAGF